MHWIEINTADGERHFLNLDRVVMVQVMDNPEGQRVGNIIFEGGEIGADPEVLPAVEKRLAELVTPRCQCGNALLTYPEQHMNECKECSEALSHGKHYEDPFSDDDEGPDRHDAETHDEI